MKFLQRPKPSLSVGTLLAIIVATIGLLTYRLGSLTSALAANETILPMFKASFSSIWNQPTELPLLLARLVAAALTSTLSISSTRLPSVLLGLLVVAASYWLLQKWYGYRLAVFGIVLLITAPWFLHISRLATSDIVYPLAMLGVMILAALWHQKQVSKWLLYTTVIASVILLYIPGTLWLLLIAAVFERRNLLTAVRTQKKQALIASVAGVILLIPMAHGLSQNVGMYRIVLGLPAAFPSPLQYIEQFFRNWQYLFFGGYDNPVYNLGALPINNALITIMFAVGIYLYTRHLSATRTQLLASLWLAGSALIAFKGPVSYVLIIPIVFVVAVGGIGYLLHLWLKTFPRNPYARSFGIGLIGVVVAFAVAYNLRNYYAAWPNASQTRAAFTRQL